MKIVERELFNYLLQALNELPEEYRK